MKLYDILNFSFRLIEENTIDIESIEEVYGFTNTSYLQGKYNELVQAVKQLNKEIQELKEKIRWKKQ